MLGRDWKSAEAKIVERRIVEEWHSKSALGEFTRTYEYMADIRPDDGTPPFRAALHDPVNSIHFRQPSPGAVVRVKYLESARHQSGSMKWQLSDVKFDQSDPGLRAHNYSREADKPAVAESNSPEGEARWEQIRASGPGGPTRRGGGRAGESQHGNQLDPRVRAARVALREARRQGNTAEVQRLTAELERLEHGGASAERSEPGDAQGAEPIERRLAKLQKLRDDGVLSADEYAAQRQRILDSI